MGGGQCLCEYCVSSVTCKSSADPRFLAFLGSLLRFVQIRGENIFVPSGSRPRKKKMIVKSLAIRKDIKFKIHFFGHLTVISATG